MSFILKHSSGNLHSVVWMKPSPLPIPGDFISIVWRRSRCLLGGGIGGGKTELCDSFCCTTFRSLNVFFRWVWVNGRKLWAFSSSVKQWTISRRNLTIGSMVVACRSIIVTSSSVIRSPTVLHNATRTFPPRNTNRSNSINIIVRTEERRLKRWKLEP